MRRSAVAAIAKAARELEGDERAKAVAEECVWPIREWGNGIRETVDDAIEVRARRLVAAVAAAGQLRRGDFDRPIAERARPGYISRGGSACRREAQQSRGRRGPRRRDVKPHLG